MPEKLLDRIRELPWWLLIIPLVSAEAYPPFIPLDERYSSSAVVLIARVTVVSQKRHAVGNLLTTLRIEVDETLKGNPPPSVFHLTFITFPRSEEGQLIRPPAKGRYIIFLEEKKVKDARGKTGRALVLYEPRVYALELATEAGIRKLKLRSLE